jgi:hypothetical protein
VHTAPLLDTPGEFAVPATLPGTPTRSRLTRESRSPDCPQGSSARSP